MSKCLQCGTEVKQTEGRRQRKFCDNKGKCRYQYWLANSPKEKKYVQKSTYDKLLAQIKENNIPENKLRILAERNNAHNLGSKHQQPEPENDIAAQIKSIRAEKIPEHRNTTIGRKSWKADQEKRIKELEQKLPS